MRDMNRLVSTHVYPCRAGSNHSSAAVRIVAIIWYCTRCLRVGPHAVSFAVRTQAVNARSDETQAVDARLVHQSRK